MIENYRSSLVRLVGVGAGVRVQAGTPELAVRKAEVLTASYALDKADMSLLGTQLSASAMRATARDSAMKPDELAAYAHQQVHDIAKDGYMQGKVQHDRELPKTDNEALLQRAQRATAFVNQSQVGKGVEPNPFAGLDREQLVLIAFDDKGSYTVNERQAALAGVETIEDNWRKGASAQGQAERNLTGRNTSFLNDALSHYRGLSKVEQALGYPEGYEKDLQAKLLQELALPGVGLSSQTPPRFSLFEVLAGNDQDATSNLRDKTRMGLEFSRLASAVLPDMNTRL